MKQELHALVGAYAVDALDDLERRRFEDHLAECETCARETRGLREAAAHLGTAVATQPPPRLRDKVLADVARVRPLPPVLANGHGRRRNRTPWLFTVVAAACFVVAVAMSGVAYFAQQRADDAVAANREVFQVLAAADAQSSTARVSTGGSGTVVASRSQGKVVVAMDGLRNLPDTQTYELWLMGPGNPRPAGLLAAAPNEPLVLSGLGEATQVGLTVEPKGGSERPTTNPIFTAPVST
jgi:anti-sigma-K factor RskA